MDREVALGRGFPSPKAFRGEALSQQLTVSSVPCSALALADFRVGRE
jgi:hypothetical protein